jgi:hypothetical protein
MYFPRIPESSSLIYRFCEFHNSSLFNPLQTNLWQRIRKAIDSTLALDDRVDLRSSPSPEGRFLLKIYLERMSHVFKTNYIPIFDPEDFEPYIPESALPGDTPCPGQSFPHGALSGLTVRLSYQLVLLRLQLVSFQAIDGRGYIMSR